MSRRLEGKRIAFLMANEGVEQVELTEPLTALCAEGAAVDLIAPEAGTIQAFNHLDRADTFPVNRTVAEVRPGEYDGLVLPGGVANPDRLRTRPEAVSLVQEFVASGKPLGVICHGPWTMVEAGVVRGRTLTSWPSIRTDIENAGGSWVDRDVVVDDGIVSSRGPDDLPAFCAKLVEELAEGVHRRAA